MPLSESYNAGDELPAADVNTFAKYINRAFKAGIVEDFFGLEADVPSGFLLCAGATIGNGSSNATARANADMATLFAILWAVGNADATLSIFTSAGAGSTYGANAAADFAANKAIALPDFRGRIAPARDNMGGSDAGRISSANGNKVGGAVGAETVNIAHTHTSNANHRSEGAGGGSVGTDYTEGSSAEKTTSGMSANENPSVIQPSLFLNKIICTGVVW